MGYTPDYTKEFDIINSVRWTALIPLFMILVVLMSWCFYFHFTRAIQARKKLIYIEVKDGDEDISRTKSK